jgi:hypothetical protein
MKRSEAIKRTQQQAGIGPEVLVILPMVFDAVMGILGACKKQENAEAACRNASPAQRGRIVAEVRRRLKASGKDAKMADVRAAVDAACKTGRDAAPSEVTAFVGNCYRMV